MGGHNFLESLWYSFLNGDTRKVLLEIRDLFFDLWPYLLVGIIISTVIKIYFTRETIYQFISGPKVLSIFIAAVLGVISPVGSYVSLPLVASLYAVGLPIAPLITFAIASPLINPGIFILTQGTLGNELAIIRVASALILGISAGLITYALEKNNTKAFSLKSTPTNDVFLEKLGQGNISLKLFTYEAFRYTRYIFKHFALGILIAALVKVMLPSEFIVNVMGDGNLSVLLATGAGVPFYSCGGAALPVLQELEIMGVNKGAILAFCISGPAIKISTLYLLNSLFRNGILFLYIGTTFIGALFLGLIYQLF